MMKIHIKYITLFSFLFFSYQIALSQEDSDLSGAISENIIGKGRVVDGSTIKLRWAPTSPKAWLHGRNYGYIVERYTVMIGNKWQDDAAKITLNPSLKLTPLPQWEAHALKSDYAAVLAQAFYGEDFDLNSTANDVGSIINRSSELEQRFATSVFMAEYDYKAAELAGWAYTDNTIKENEKYVYRIILDRPIKQEGDTAAIFIGFADKEDLLPPMELSGRWGDKSVMLMWNYELRVREYHSYHVEKKGGEIGAQFERITDLPITVLDANMQEAFHVDTLQNNDVEYAYRIIGLTSFGEESPASNIIVGQGEKQVHCIPQIYAGEFISDNEAEIFWEFECEEIDYVEKLQISKSEQIDGEFTLLVDNIAKTQKTLRFNIEDAKTYLKLTSVNKNGTQQISHPFQLQKIDSIPPAIPRGLAVVIDSLGVAHLRWDANAEKDLRGYRILRSFAAGNEKSVLTPQFLSENNYTDTLSLDLSNEKVYYSLTSLDMRYNESEPCPEVVALKPNNSTPHLPTITRHEVVDGKVELEWLVDSTRTDIVYILERIAADSVHAEVLYTGDYAVNVFVDEPETSGSYQYSVAAKNSFGKIAKTPTPLHLFVQTNSANNKISRFNAYTNTEDGYIELSWKKHDKARLYRIYKSEDEKPMTLWQELDTETNRVVDERISPNTKYTYTILFTTQTEGLSKISSVSVDY